MFLLVVLPPLCIKSKGDVIVFLIGSVVCY